MLKVGLIGCGGMGSMHAACYEAMGDLIQVTAAADVRMECAEKACVPWGGKAYTSAEEMLKTEEFDFVDICVPTYLHTKYAVMAMEVVGNVFIEKPVCLSKEEAGILIAAKQRTGAKVQIGQVIRFWKEYVWLKETMEKGPYGKIKSAVFSRLSQNPVWGWENWFNDPAKSGTAGLDLHIHDVDYVRYLMGQPDTFSSVAARDDGGVLQEIITTYHYGNVPIIARGCWDMPDKYPFSMSFCVKFEQATVEFDSACKSLCVHTDTQSFTPQLAGGFESTKDLGINVSELGGYYNELLYFANGIKDHTDLTVAPLEEGVQSLYLALDEIEATGGQVSCKK